MKVVILCGGQGTRIRDVSEDLPKPMIPVGGRPILWHIMKLYAAQGFHDFILCLGYKGHVIKDFFLNYEARMADVTITLGRDRALEYHGSVEEDGWKVTLADTGLNALTGTRLSAIRNYVGDDEEFFMTYGDGVGDVDLAALLAFHRSHGRVATVTGVRPPGRFGEMMADGQGQVAEFNEKPQATGGTISGGFFVFKRKVFDYLAADANQMLEEEPMRALVRDGQLMLFRHDGFWQCMDTYRDYALLNSLWDGGKAPWRMW